MRRTLIHAALTKVSLRDSVLSWPSRYLLDCDAVPVSHYPNQFGMFSFKYLSEPGHLGICYLHATSFVRRNRYGPVHGMVQNRPPAIWGQDR